MSNNKAFTLIEVLISMLIILVVLLGIFQGIALYVNHNLATLFRNEAVKIAQECAEKLRNLEFCTSTASATDPVSGVIERDFRRLKKTFTVVYPNPANFDKEQPNLVTIQVFYDFRGKNYQYQFTTIVYPSGS